MDQLAIRAIQAMLTPVVLMKTAAILAGGNQTMYAAVNDRIRAMTAERFSRLTDDRGEVSKATTPPDAGKDRLRQIDTELPLLLGRHCVLLLIYTAVLLVVISMVLVAVSITVPAPAAGDVALVFLLASTVALMLGLILVAVSVRHSANAIATKSNTYFDWAPKGLGRSGRTVSRLDPGRRIRTALTLFVGRT